MLDFGNPFIIGLTAVCAAVFLLFLLYGSIFIAQKKYVKRKWDIVFSVFNWIFFVGFLFFFVLSFMFAYAATLMAPLNALAFLGEGYLAHIFIGLAFLAILFCAIVHIVKARKIATFENGILKSLQAARSKIKESLESLERAKRLREEAIINPSTKELTEVEIEATKERARQTVELAAVSIPTEYEETKFSFSTTIVKQVEEIESLISETNTQISYLEQPVTKPEAIKGEEDDYDEIRDRVFSEVREFTKTDELSEEEIASEIKAVAKVEGDKAAIEIEEEIEKEVALTQDSKEQKIENEAIAAQAKGEEKAKEKIDKNTQEEEKMKPKQTRKKPSQKPLFASKSPVKPKPKSKASTPSSKRKPVAKGKKIGDYTILNKDAAKKSLKAYIKQRGNEAEEVVNKIQEIKIEE